jgi:hypothetical protein
MLGHKVAHRWRPPQKVATTVARPRAYWLVALPLAALLSL